MKHNVVDARGRSCPEPVVMTKNAIDKFDGQPIEVLVDAMVAVENIKRFARNQGFDVEVIKNEEDYTLIIRK
ncbi:preprotein translocase subunit TatB [Caloranaerobacter azorensis H53214]|uniref:Preprotein translocase subunit TatB n=1 Tax=Caloranaerobacter azorensis H53214 TaxID=1156417 RepID=A0A096CVN7_9FIRM|nr:sulfurtransferase TusA family protein [Caloranaerobacter azorensis]KGG80594.1 preprotein translocase subunit TatB [Caloranaerobacter azorensis H53214]